MRKLFLLMMSCCALLAQAQPIELKMGDGVPLTITPLADNAVRVRRGPAPTLPEYTYVAPTDPKEKIKYKVTTKNGITNISMKGMAIDIDLQNGYICYYDDKGRPVLNEEAYDLTPSTVQDVNTNIATVQFDSPASEFLYGLGQFQDGYLNVRGLSRRLTQVNTQISLPMYLSSRGYAVLWNNYGMTEFNPGEFSDKMERVSEGGTTEVNVTTTAGGRREQRRDSHFETVIDVPFEDDYSILLDVGQTMARRHNLVIDDTVKVIDVQNTWLPPTTSCIVHLKEGKHKFASDLTSGDKPTIHYSRVKAQTVLSSPVAECVDYSVFIGFGDNAIASYRKVTGQSPMPPAWVFGYVHCRERFHSSDEILSTAQTFRDKQLPMDVIVQDWQWWGKYGWNAMKFDEQYYPDPKALVDQLHQKDARLMLSVWSKIDKNSEVGKEAQSKGYYIPGTDWIDFFNPEAADYYWNNFSSKLLKPYGIDCWWQDAVEPENDDLRNRRINNGKWPGELLRNTYPLMVSKVVYEGNMKDRPDQRTSILTRCAAPGIQRYGSFLWSGDVGNDWKTLHHQVVAGLGVAAAGHPWWTYDAGGFFRPGGGQYSDPAYRKRFLRWLQVSTFLPMMRVHGYQTDTEFWRFGEEVEQVARQQLNLRYRLFPYIYSTAYEVTQGSTMMRPLIMDFSSDKVAIGLDNQYMFGKSLMVGVLGEDNDKEFRMYFPRVNGGWYDLYTGKYYTQFYKDQTEKSQASRNGGRYITMRTDGNSIPCFVKAGTILPMGKVMQSTAKYDPSEMDIKIFPGANATFTLYEDDGVSTKNEKGEYCTIEMKWDNTTRTFTIGATKGSYEGMPKERVFHVALSEHESIDVKYNGGKKSIKLKL